MCDQTEVPYLPGNIVWVKLGPVWWPGRVCDNDEVPEEVLKELRKTPIAIVKFFQEESFEYVKKLTNIYHYNCLKKNDFIKKGLDMCRSSNRDTPSNMKLFPEDVVTAETLTDGNPDIIHDDMFKPEKKVSYAQDFSPKKTPKKPKIERKKETLQQQPAKPAVSRVITHPRFVNLGVCDYEARVRKQEPVRVESDEDDTPTPTTYKCPDCNFTTVRLNVMVFHNKSHSANYASSFTPVKGVKRKSTGSAKIREKRVDNGAAKPKRSNAGKKPRDKQDERKDSKPPAKRGRPSEPRSEEFQNSLLEDWADFENEQERADDGDDFNDSGSSRQDTLSEANEDSVSSVKQEQGKKSPDTKAVAETSSKSKSCFDFDDSEDHIVIDKSKIKFGRKIPRVLDEKPSASLKSSDAKEDVDTNSVDETDKSVDMDSITNKSQLQEMGVDNEIEINSEEAQEEPAPVPPPVEAHKEALKITDREDEELQEKVDKLLEEIGTCTRLPDIPQIGKKKFAEADLSSGAEKVQSELIASSAGKLKSTPVKSTSPVKVLPAVNSPSKITVDINAHPKPVVVALSKGHEAQKVSPTKPSQEPGGQKFNVGASSLVRLKCPETGERRIVLVNSEKNQTAANSRGKINVTLATPSTVVTNSTTPARVGTLKTIVVAGQAVGTGATTTKFVINKSKPNIILSPQKGAAAGILSGTACQKIVRVPSNVLQKSVSVTQLNKVPVTNKNIVLTQGLQGGLVVLQPQKQVMLVPTTSSDAAPSDGDSDSQNSTLVSMNTSQSNSVYVNSSGNPITTPKSTNLDILAKALEDTDGLQTEIGFTSTAPSQSVLDTISVAHNTPITYKGGDSIKVYETNLTLNTPPIMSAYEAPSRALVPAAAVLSEVPNEMIIISGNSESNEFIA